VSQYLQFQIEQEIATMSDIRKKVQLASIVLLLLALMITVGAAVLGSGFLYAGDCPPDGEAYCSCEGYGPPNGWVCDYCGHCEEPQCLWSPPSCSRCCECTGCRPPQ
jgi:hypothetical protein